MILLSLYKCRVRRATLTWQELRAGNPVSAVPGRLRAALAGGLELVEALVAEAARADHPGEAPVDIAGVHVCMSIF